MESILVDSALLESANRWFDISWYGLLWAGGVTALGAVLTVAFLFLQFWSSGVRERHTEWRTSSLELQTAEATRDTAEAQERIAQLNNETARLRDSALANAEAGRANVLASLANRTVMEAISVAQGLVERRATSEATRAVYIIPKVEPFAGKHFDALVTSNDLELELLLGTLRSTLKIAGWIEVDLSDKGTIHREQFKVGGSGLVTVNVDASKNSGLLDAANALASALNAEGIAATVNPKAESANAKVIHIVVSPKPPTPGQSGPR